MTMRIIRRKGLGFGSAKGLALASDNIDWVRNDRFHTKDWDDVRYAIRWGCTSTLPRRSDGSSIPVVNKASAIHLVNDKARFRMDCQYAGLPVPSSFTSMDQVRSFPCIVRSRRHSRGRNLWVFDNLPELQEHTRNMGADNWYASEFIEKVAEYRVYIVAGKVVWVSSKEVEDPSEPAWNRARTGCEFVNVRWNAWNLEVCKAAISCFKLSGLDFGGVDVVVDSDGKAYVIEINSAASLPMFEGEVSYRQKCVARAFDYHYRMASWTYLESPDTNNYRDIIHPSAL